MESPKSLRHRLCDAGLVGEVLIEGYSGCWKVLLSCPFGNEAHVILTAEVFLRESPLQSALLRDASAKESLYPRSFPRSYSFPWAACPQLLINQGYEGPAFLLRQLQRQVWKIIPSLELPLRLAKVSVEIKLQLDFLLF